MVCLRQTTLSPAEFFFPASSCKFSLSKLHQQIRALLQSPPLRNPFVLSPRRTKPSDPAFLFLSLFSVRFVTMFRNALRQSTRSLGAISAGKLAGATAVCSPFQLLRFFCSFDKVRESRDKWWDWGLMSWRNWLGTIPNGLPSKYTD